ncbi:mfs peptide [Moniliophthora roreri MCA 2997]|uniref:Mfs peptide n=1 Tax=Moniliophthora roreri (strain MCA 2997) TaxID=1381753 RepID=V2YYS2_MONRO|nr:mfs peptide [Moniliophthora roreri MCA 2997]
MNTPDHKQSIDDHASAPTLDYSDDDGRPPTEEERATLQRIPGNIPWTAYTICIVEFAERASYFGCAAVFSNFIQRPLPPGGNGAGAPPPGTQLSAGALGLGLQAATAITKTFSFVAFALPILGGILADQRWGRFKTVCIGTALCAIAHVILVIAAIPSVIAGGHAIVPFIISIVILALGTGFIKPCIVPILSDQSAVKSEFIKTLPNGKKVIVDPSLSVQNMITIYCWSINFGTFFTLATSYSAKRVGYWLAFTIPGALFFIMPLGLILVNRRIVKVAPEGSALLDVFRMFRVIGFKGLLRGGDSWDVARPSKKQHLDTRKSRMITWDDEFVDEVRRTLRACRLFLLMPIYLVADVGLDNILVNQAASMTSNGAPNDLIQSFNALTLVFFTPFFQYVIWPFFHRMKIKTPPVRRMVAGYIISALGMVFGAVLQYRVYKTSPCGYSASTCSLKGSVSPISIWWQVPIPALEAIASICINYTSYEIAITMAPRRMKSLVFAIVLFMAALSSALVLIVSPTFVDPNLIWPFAALAVATTICGMFTWIFLRDMDDEYERVVSKGVSST